MQSDGSESENHMTHHRVQSQSLSSSDTRGKHRIHAELKRLEQETRYLEVATSSSSLPCFEVLFFIGWFLYQRILYEYGLGTMMSMVV